MVGVEGVLSCEPSAAPSGFSTSPSPASRSAADGGTGRAPGAKSSPGVEGSPGADDIAGAAGEAASPLPSVGVVEVAGDWDEPVAGRHRFTGSPPSMSTPSRFPKATSAADRMGATPARKETPSSSGRIFWGKSVPIMMSPTAATVMPRGATAGGGEGATGGTDSLRAALHEARNAARASNVVRARSTLNPRRESPARRLPRPAVVSARGSAPEDP